MALRFDHIKTARTSARVLSVCLFLLWGAFFVEHLEWFSAEQPNTPPIHVWFAQGAHLLLLIGYIVLLRFELAGSVLVVINAVLFFGYAAGTNAIPFVIVSTFPVMLLGYCSLKERRGGKKPEMIVSPKP